MYKFFKIKKKDQTLYKQKLIKKTFFSQILTNKDLYPAI